MSAIDAVTEITSLLEQWDRECGTGNGPVRDAVPILTRMAEIVEGETEAWYKMDPDPFDDRHPGRADPTCTLGHVLQAIFKNDNFLNKLVSSYPLGPRDTCDIQTVACRLFLDVMPGLETTIIFADNDALVLKLIQWAQTEEEPLRSYSVGLLAAAMEVQDLAGNFKEQNALLVPLLLKRLNHLITQKREESSASGNEKFDRPFANIGQGSLAFRLSQQANKLETSRGSRSKTIQTAASEGTSSGTPPQSQTNSSQVKGDALTETSTAAAKPGAAKADRTSTAAAKPGAAKADRTSTAEDKSPPSKRHRADTDKERETHKGKTPKPAAPTFSGAKDAMKNGHYKLTSKIHQPLVKPAELKVTKPIAALDCSNSSWADIERYVIGSYSLLPLSPEMQMRLIVQYLTPVGEYQELLSHVFEQHAIDLIFYLMDLSQNTDVRLAFEALKYLGALLCHKRFAIQFISRGGVERMLDVYRPSVAATGVSMCLYYLSYFEDAMERVCMLPPSVLSNLVSYVLWLLECSHESGRCHATMFFGHSFPFRIILELFDAQDGFRKLYNVISTLAILNIEEDNSSIFSDDEVFTSRQAARHVCVALKKYFEAHLAIKADQIRRSHMRNEGGSPIAEMPAYKAYKQPAEVIADNIELLLECLPYRIKWEPVQRLIKLGGITLLMQLVAMAMEWGAYTGKGETIRSALDVLFVCSVTPKTQMSLCETVSLPESGSIPATSVLLGLAEGELLADADVQKSALNVINNCVGGPVARLGANLGRIVGGSTKKKVTLKNGEDLLSKMWEAVRANNGIMVLLKLLSVKTPITEADCIRAMACKALVGLARSDTVKQIISKLPLFNNGELQFLMREAVLQDKRMEYLRFCKFANELIERVSGKTRNANMEASLDRIRKADIVAQTKIVYHDKELLQLIKEHLVAKGLTESAQVLQKEAELPRLSTPPPPHPASAHIFSTPKILRRNSLQLHNNAVLGSPGNLAGSPCSRGSTVATPGTPSHGPIRVNVISSKVQQSGALSNQTRMQQTKSIIRQKHEALARSEALPSPMLKRQVSVKQDRAMSLDKIVTEYLRQQHALCKNPIETCPQFNLLGTHRCPEPRHRNSAPVNMTARLLKKSINPRFGGATGRGCDRKFVYSRFRPIRSYRDTEEDGCFSSCAFSACERFIMLGTYAGELKWYNIQSGDETANFVCHSSPLTHMQPSSSGSLVLTSSSWGTPLSALWTMGDTFDMKHSFDEDYYVEFSKQTQDRIIGTKDDTARLYDVETGRLLRTLRDQGMANHYACNRATFHPNDELVLNDGVLWDVNSGKTVHKFDKFNPNISGLFHPMGLEIIINSEVWDIRNFHLLHTVQGLDQCHIRFNHAGDVIYGAIHQDDEEVVEDDKIKSPFGSSFRTFDGTDYSNIATVDVKRNIFDLCTDSSDCFLAVIENQRAPDTMSDESMCRLYEVGRLRDEDEDQTEEDEEEDEGVDDDDDDDDDVDDDVDDDGSDNSDHEDNDDEDDIDDNSDSSSDDSDSTAVNPYDALENISEGDYDSDDDIDNMLFELSDYSNF